MDPQDLQAKWDEGVCTYPLCPMKNMVNLNCVDCPALASDIKRVASVEAPKQPQLSESEEDGSYDPEWDEERGKYR